jgi:hypothetical protein
MSEIVEDIRIANLEVTNSLGITFTSDVSRIVHTGNGEFELTVGGELELQAGSVTIECCHDADGECVCKRGAEVVINGGEGHGECGNGGDVEIKGGKSEEHSGESGNGGSITVKGGWSANETGGNVTINGGCGDSNGIVTIGNETNGYIGEGHQVEIGRNGSTYIAAGGSLSFFNVAPQTQLGPQVPHLNEGNTTHVELGTLFIATGTTAYTIDDIVFALKKYGILQN